MLWERNEIVLDYIWTTELQLIFRLSRGQNKVPKDVVAEVSAVTGGFNRHS